MGGLSAHHSAFTRHSSTEAPPLSFRLRSSEIAKAQIAQLKSDIVLMTDNSCRAVVHLSGGLNMDRSKRRDKQPRRTDPDRSQVGQSGSDVSSHEIDPYGSSSSYNVRRAHFRDTGSRSASQRYRGDFKGPHQPRNEEMGSPNREPSRRSSFKQRPASYKPRSGSFRDPVYGESFDSDTEAHVLHRQASFIRPSHRSSFPPRYPRDYSDSYIERYRPGPGIPRRNTSFYGPSPERVIPYGARDPFAPPGSYINAAQPTPYNGHFPDTPPMPPPGMQAYGLSTQPPPPPPPPLAEVGPTTRSTPIGARGR